MDTTLFLQNFLKLHGTRRGVVPVSIRPTRLPKMRHSKTQKNNVAHSFLLAVQTHIHTRMHARTHQHTHTHTRRDIQIDTRRYEYTLTYTHTHTHAHAHMNARASARHICSSSAVDDSAPISTTNVSERRLNAPTRTTSMMHDYI